MLWLRPGNCVLLKVTWFQIGAEVAVLYLWDLVVAAGGQQAPLGMWGKWSLPGLCWKLSLPGLCGALSRPGLVTLSRHGLETLSRLGLEAEPSWAVWNAEPSRAGS